MTESINLRLASPRSSDLTQAKHRWSGIFRLLLGFAFLISSLYLPFCAFAQTPTIVTGTIKDANGLVYANARVTAQLIPSTASPTVIGSDGIPHQIGGLNAGSADVNGNFTMNLFCNSAGGGCSPISPSGTQWQFTVTTNGQPPPLGSGPQSCTATLTITGASQSVSASFSACSNLGVGPLAGIHSGTDLFKNINLCRFADQFPGATADVKIANAIADLPAAGGCVDARGFGATVQTIAARLQIGSTTQTVTLFLDRVTQWNCTITNGVDPCFDPQPGSAMIFTGEIVTLPNAGITFSANANVLAAIRNTQQNGGNFVGFYLEGATIIPNATMTFVDSVLSLQNPLQLTIIKGISIGGGNIPANTILEKVYCTAGKACGNVSNENVQLDGGGTGKPVWTGCTSQGSLTLVSCNQTPFVSFSGAATALVHPCSGCAIADLEQGNGAAGTNPGIGTFFDHPQMESSHVTDLGILCNGCVGLTVNGLGATAVVPGADLIRIAQPAGTVADGINITGVVNQGLWTNTINNQIITDTVPSSACANGCAYHYHKNFSATATEVWADGTGRIMTKGQNGLAITRGISGNLPLGPTTFAALGTPGNGNVIFCSDCTIANPCAGAGTGALAKRLNGVWVCN